MVKYVIFAGDAFNRDMQLDLNTEYHVTRFRIDCRLADAFDNVDVAVTLMVCEDCVYIRHVQGDPKRCAPIKFQL